MSSSRLYSLIPLVGMLQATSVFAAQAEEGTLYSCPDGFSFIATPAGESLLLVTPEGKARLPQVKGASGARYGNEQTEFWSKGDQASLRDSGQEHKDCTAVDNPLPILRNKAEGLVFKASGNEPGWTLSIYQDGTLSFVGDYGHRSARFPNSREVAALDGKSISHFSMTESAALALHIAKRECKDSMSGQASSSTVQLILDGDYFSGCGMDIAEAVKLAEQAEGRKDAPPGTTDNIELSFTEECWVEIADALKEAKFSGMMQAGDKRTVQGKPPFTLVLGNPDAVQLSINGKADDLKRYAAKSSKIRFELDPAKKR